VPGGNGFTEFQNASDTQTDSASSTNMSVRRI
jgi:hypothetical protein